MNIYYIYIYIYIYEYTYTYYTTALRSGLGKQNLFNLGLWSDYAKLH